ncbi:unnamed protein product [Leptidea sinapis]|uniref:Major facilitator superfamily (MFS) profile domain-containing protein n=1 Tax=Leptidea sinapis TaxID=189913 RepID=A0A5E4Q885_9NEOP|nr:unnamed protein product [Leptidea sinapis]
MTEPVETELENGTIVPEFDWSSQTKGLVLSSFFYGYLITQLPGGWLAAKIGGNRMFAIGVGATSLFTLFTPPLAHTSTSLLIAVRVIEGLFERARLATFAFSGSYVGTVVVDRLSVDDSVVACGDSRRSLYERVERDVTPVARDADVTAGVGHRGGALRRELGLLHAAHFETSQTGWLSAVPYLAMAMVLQVSGHLADWLMVLGVTSRTNVRKWFTCGARSLSRRPGTPAPSLRVWCVSPSLVNHLDIAAPHASVLMGLSNSVATLPGIVSPPLAGAIVTDKQNNGVSFSSYRAVYIFSEP